MSPDSILYQKYLSEDVKEITGIEVNLHVRSHSKTLRGYYDPNSDIIVVYLRYSQYSCVHTYYDLLETAVHEAVHCMQWRDPLFKRIKGVMHNTQFYSKMDYFLPYIQEVSDKRENLV